MSVSESSLRRLEKALDKVQKATGRNAQNSVKQAAIHLSKSGKASFGRGNKGRSKNTRRQILAFKKSLQHKGADPKRPFYLVVLKQNGSRTLLKQNPPLKKRKSPYIPENIGIAWRSWGWILKKLPGNQDGGNLSPFNRKARRINTTADVDNSRWKSRNSTITITNRLTYLEDHIPGLSDALIEKAANKIEKIAESGWGKMKSSWRS